MDLPKLLDLHMPSLYACKHTNHLYVLAKKKVCTSPRRIDFHMRIAP